jgi:hypothetical protein
MMGSWHGEGFRRVIGRRPATCNSSCFLGALKPPTTLSRWGMACRLVFLSVHGGMAGRGRVRTILWPPAFVAIWAPASHRQSPFLGWLAGRPASVGGACRARARKLRGCETAAVGGENACGQQTDDRLAVDRQTGPRALPIIFLNSEFFFSASACKTRPPLA